MHLNSSSAREWPRPSAHLLAALALIPALLSGSACAAIATSAVDADVDAALEAPADMDGTVHDLYRHAPSFNNGGDYPDHFAGAPNADMVGLLTAPLANGDIVVAGLVPNFGASGTCSNGTSLCNIGLVRYNATGVRVPWPDPTGFGFNGNQYVVYPNDVSTGYQYLRDLQVVDGTIYVLQDGFNASQPGLGRQNVSIVSFFDNGRPRGSISVFGGASADTEDFYGAKMVFLSGGRLIVTATDYDGTSSYLAATRLLVGTGGVLNQDPTWGSAYPGSGNRIIRYPASVPYTVAYAANQVGFPVQDDFYVAGNVTLQGDSDVLVQKISGVTGAYKNEFDGNGSTSIDFANAGGSHDDYAGGLYVYRDDVYVAAQVGKLCTTGVGVARIDGTTGQLNTAFGIGGKVEFGGTDPATCNVSYTQSVSPTAMSATGGRLGIVGYVRSIVQGTSDQRDPLLAVVDAVDGNILDWSRRPIRKLDSTTYGSGIAYSVFGGPDPASPFTVAGTVQDDANGGHLDFFTSVFRPSSDLIFYSGVEVVRQIPD